MLCSLESRSETMGPEAGRGGSGKPKGLDRRCEAANEGEQGLLSIAASLIGHGQTLTPSELNLLRGVHPAAARAIEPMRSQILAGHDPLGAEFCRLRSAERR